MPEAKALNIVMLPPEDAPDDYKSRVIRYETQGVYNHKGEIYAVVKEQSQVKFMELTKLELVCFTADVKAGE